MGDRAGAVQARDGKYLEEERPSLQVEAGFWAGRKGRGLGPAVAMASCLCPPGLSLPICTGHLWILLLVSHRKEVCAKATWPKSSLQSTGLTEETGAQ